MTLRSSRMLPVHGICRSISTAFFIHRFSRHVVFFADHIDKVIDQQGNILRVFAQGVGTLIRITPIRWKRSSRKFSFFNLFSQVLVRRRDDPHVQIDHPIAANTHDLPLLNDTQQLRLHSRRNISDLVQKNRPVIRPFKITDFPVFVRSGKRAADIAEELGFQQIFGDRCTVHADKRSVLTL